MKELFKFSGGLFGKLIVVVFMSFFLAISFNVLATAVFTENIGYIAYGTVDGEEEPKELYTHYFKDGEDKKIKEYEAEGYTVTTNKIRSQLTKTGDAVYLTITQVFSYMILIMFIYPKFWDKGNNDSNLVRFKHKSEDKLFGLKAGLLAMAMYLIFISVIYLLLSKDFSIAVFKLLNAYNFSIIEVICGKALTFGELSVIKIIALILIQFIVPLTTFAAYLLGYKNINLSEKITYKKETN